MGLAPFLIGIRPMHPEHAEHHAQHRTIRLDQPSMRHCTVVVRCQGAARLRLRFALLLMRLAGRIGGFRQIEIVRKPAS